MSAARFAEYLSRPWSLRASERQTFTEILMRHFAGEKLEPAEIDARIADAHAAAGIDGRPGDGRQFEISGGVAVIPIEGVIAPYSRMVNHTSQPRGTSCARIAEDLDRAMARNVHTVLLHVESPGGFVDGVPDLADRLAEIRGDVRLVAYASNCAASAAYWLAAQASEFYASPGAAIGSIGVYAPLIDTSAQASARGIRVDVVRSGKHKGAGVPGAPISPEQRAAIQEEIDAHADLFRAAVARGRGMDPEDVAPLATGKCYIGTAAAAVGLIDATAIYSDLLARLQDEGGTAGGRATQPTRDREPEAARPAAAAQENPMPKQTDQPTAQAEQPTPQTPAQADPPQPSTTAQAPTAPQGASIDALEEAFPGNAAFVLKAFKQGLTVEGAKALAFDELYPEAVKQAQTAQAERDELKAALKTPGVTQAMGIDPSDTGAGDGATRAQKFQARLEELKAEGKTQAQAIATAAKEDDAGRHAWNVWKAQQAKGEK